MRGLIFFAALAMAVPASAQVTLTPGQGVTVAVSAGGKVSAERVHPAALAPDDLEAVGMLRDSYPAIQKSQSDPKGVLPAIPMRNSRVPAGPIKPDRIEIVFEVIDGKDSVLAIRNGYGQGLTYRAQITARGRTAPTDVCLVMPGKRGYEHWPYAIDRIELTELTLADWTPDQGIPCR
ncbi:hypothetical protein OF829_05680 [Sphingomonas sp. LB-2]|uniref:hypothetical protein n=1 Tax=Sphingomonas caeni TaxID=2984949 RepID=UPI00222FAF75|nr:hypothetical protein [Sphingomonas caeni]MCW3846721.1 hypothetical protein [Sphingomonas caeni]